MDNNIFKFATKELSQDAFLCWCINWINMEDKSSNMYKFGKGVLFDIIFGENDNSEYVELKEDFNNDNINIKVTRQLNITTIDDNDKRDRKKNRKKDGKKDDKKQNRMDVVVTINNKYVVIIEDKINAFISEDKNKNKNKDKDKENQIDRYEKTIEFLQNNADKYNEKIELLDLSVENISEWKVIPIFIKTGIFNDAENELTCSKVDGNRLLKIIGDKKDKIDDKYKYFVDDFYNNLKERLDINNLNKYECISNAKRIKIGEKFLKNITIYNCFYKYFDIIHFTAKKYVNDKGVFEDSKRLTQCGISMNSKDSHIQIWNPRFVYVSKNWKNEKVDGKFDEISERFVVDEDKKKISDFFSDDILLRYVFSLERDEFGKVYYIFRGLYKNLDYNKKKRISEGRKWKRINSDDKDFFSLIDDKGNVSIDIKKVCELIAKMDQ